MKKSLFTVFGLLLLCVTFFSCNNITNLSVTKEKVLGLANDEFYISANMANIERTIFPDEWDSNPARKDALKYVLTGKLNGTSTALDFSTAEADGRIFDYNEISGNAATAKKVKISAGHWELWLTAYQVDASGNVDSTKPVLQGHIADADLTRGAQEINFYLQPVYSYKEDGATGTHLIDVTASATNSAGTGNIDIKVNFTPTVDLKNIKVSLVDYETQTNVINAVHASGNVALEKTIPITGIVPADPAAAIDSIVTFGAGAATGSKKISVVATVPTGHYYFKVKFEDGAATPNSLGTFAEDVYVDGGNTSQKEFFLDDVIAKTANNPINFKVATEYNDKVLQPSDTPDTTFKAKFTWNDNSLNEDGFEIIILQDADADTYQALLDADPAGTISYDKYNELISASATITPYLILDPTTALNASGTTAKDMIDGNLKPASQKCTVLLETGHKYLALIRAFNKYDKDAEHELMNSAARNEANTIAGINTFGVFTVKYTYASAELITSLKDGNASYEPFSIYIANNKSSDADTLGYVQSFKYNKTEKQKPIYVGNNADNALRIQANSGAEFQYWVDDTTPTLKYEFTEDVANDITHFAAAQYENLTVTGIWISSHSVLTSFISYVPANSLQLAQAVSPGHALPARPGDTVTITVSNNLKDSKFVINDYNDTTVWDGDEAADPAVAGFSVTDRTGSPTANMGGKLVWDTTATTHEESATGAYKIIISGTFEWDDNGHPQSKAVSETIYVQFEN